MADSGEGEIELTPQLFLRVQKGDCTEKEREFIRNQLRDPHSVLHDWLEGLASLVPPFSRKNRNPHEAAADAMLREAAYRTDRNEIATFLRRCQATGRIDEDHVSEVLSAGQIDTTSTAASGEQYKQAVAAMLALIVRKHPELATEVEKLGAAHDHHDFGRG
ncbi:MAG TPA: hypothetical protein VHQ47_06105 [Phycisphaerae bacterium]|nr:hypothetical protein [Phycisphaerae bacterium]